MPDPLASTCAKDLQRLKQITENRPTDKHKPRNQYCNKCDAGNQTIARITTDSYALHNSHINTFLVPDGYPHTVARSI
jgi:hypothetical protein